MVAVESKFPINTSKMGVGFFHRHINDQELDTDKADGAAMSSETTFNIRWRLLRLFLHFDAGCSQTLTITWVSKDGTNYSTVISTQALAAATDIYIQGEETDIFEKGDELKVTITAASGAPHAYLTIIGLEMP